ncbi:LacI family DNA-binding transcriptional regulator [Myceligenerans crystallogenes]|uniref:LacI family DNA-binding transcriptional regulator n=1 Tax=Myceligenerans crystallogenes TaxID=316335 RepID=A0ABP4ZX55_9MICO
MTSASRSPGARRPTIREVAGLAGLSHQTVSRHLRGDDTVNEAARARIDEAIARLGYRPSLLARAMRDRRTGRLAVALPSGLAVSSLAILDGVRQTAEAAGYTVEVITLSGAPDARRARVLELSDAGFFEGIVSLMPLPGLAAEEPRTPLLVVPRYDENMRSIGDLADASILHEIMDRLAAGGHRRFLHLAGDHAHTSARERRRVFEEAAVRLGAESYDVVDCDWDPGRALEAIRGLPADGATAVVAATDVLAAAAIRAATERGWQVPRDLSVTGWDDNPVAAVMLPSLTSVSHDHHMLGRHAAASLLAVLRGEAAPGEPGPIATVLWRESTGAAPVHERR